MSERESLQQIAWRLGAEEERDAIVEYLNRRVEALKQYWPEDTDKWLLISTIAKDVEEGRHRDK